MTTYVTKDGDQIDAITYQYYDGLPGAYEAVLKANRGLSALSHPLQAGVKIELPLLLPAGKEAEISLWD